MEPCTDYDAYACPPSHTVTVQSVVHQEPAPSGLAVTGADPTQVIMIGAAAILAATALLIRRNRKDPLS